MTQGRLNELMPLARDLQDKEFQMRYNIWYGQPIERKEQKEARWMTMMRLEPYNIIDPTVDAEIIRRSALHWEWEYKHGGEEVLEDLKAEHKVSTLNAKVSNAFSICVPRNRRIRRRLQAE